MRCRACLRGVVVGYVGALWSIMAIDLAKLMTRIPAEFTTQVSLQCVKISGDEHSILTVVRERCDDPIEKAGLAVLEHHRQALGPGELIEQAAQGAIFWGLNRFRIPASQRKAAAMREKGTDLVLYQAAFMHRYDDRLEYVMLTQTDRPERKSLEPLARKLLGI